MCQPPTQGDPGRATAGVSKKTEPDSSSVIPTKSERSQVDSQAPMGNATTRTLERVAAAVGMLTSAPIEFQTAWDVPQCRVLLALPALLSRGLVRRSPQMYDRADGI